ncbi:unnamed protein product, partial [Candidula unifasciata]
SLQQHSIPQQQPQTLRTETRRSKPVKGPSGLEEQGKKTVQAFGEGLTTIERPDEDDSAGNIYTNAVPPWMQPGQDTTPSSYVVGPTLEDLEKHKKLEQKRQLPACRVGAKFDHKSGETGSWLPDFGGVWNHGRRTKSGHQFMKRQKRGVNSHSSSSSTLLGDSDKGPVPLPQSSYLFPKLPRRTATVTSNSDILTNSSHGQSVDKLTATATDLGSVFPLVVPQNAEFCYHQDTEMSSLSHGTSSAVSRSLTGTSYNSSAVPRSQTGNAFHQMTDAMDTDNSVTVKPYVRKNRNASSTVSEQNQPMLPLCSPHIPPYCPVGLDTLNRRNGTSETHTYSSLNSEIHFESSSFISGHDGNWHNNSSAYQRPVQIGQSSVYAEQQGPFRLLATPILSQQKSKLSSEKIFETGGHGK